MSIFREGTPNRAEHFLCVIIFVLFAVASMLGLFDGLEVKTLDFRFRQRPPSPPDDRVIILAISDDCLAELGNWPWPRTFHAQVLDILKKAGASAVAFDMLFQDPSDRDPKEDSRLAEVATRFLRVFKLLLGVPNEDDRLVEATAGFGHVILPVHLVPVRVVHPESLEMVSETEVYRPFEKLASAARGFGFINVDYQNLNPDGIIRRIPLTLSAGDRLYPALSVAMVREVLGETALSCVEPIAISGRVIPQTVLPALVRGSDGWKLSTRPAYLVNYRGDATSGAFPMVYYSDLIKGRVNPALFKNRIVLVGATAAGLSDVKLTPFEEMPGVMIHANVVQNLLRGNFLLQVGPLERLLILLLLAAIGWFTLVRLSSGVGTATVIFAVALYNLIAYQLFLHVDTVIEMVAPTLLVGVQFTAGRFLQMFSNLKEAYLSIKERSVALEESNRLLDRQVTDLSILNEVANRLSSKLAMEPLSNEVLRAFQDLWHAPVALVAMVEGDDMPLKSINSIGFDGDDGQIVLFDPNVAAAIKTLREERRFVSTPDGRWFTSYLPLLMGNRLWGAIMLKESSPTPDRFREKERFYLTLLGIAATALENARLYNLATVDILTHLYVRQYFQIQIEQELKRAKRYGHNLALLMTDIDHFKHFNDSYGHQQGDIVLREVATVVKKSLREIDIAARYGGEEFCVVLPETSLDGALIVAERIRRNIETMPISRFESRGEPLRVTISIGVCAVPEHDVNIPDDMVKLADQALYQAKGKGRNRVEYIAPKTSVSA
ncbi:MAG: CHASE2 domain-containing protein [Candidatus Riflebacteria bacterium]|nr:CHASE2 domain-containing protein [Candidatus Riflebacteria bacterium]